MILYLECRSYGIALDIPTTRDEAASTIFSLIAGFEDEPAEISIIGVNSPIPNLYPYVQHADLESGADLEKLNTLDARINGMTQEEQHLFSGALELECTGDLDFAVHVATSLDRYEIFPKIKTDEDLGRFLVDTAFMTGKFSFPDEARPYLDYSKIGAEQRDALGGIYTPHGLVKRREEAPVQEETPKAMLLTLTASEQSYPLVLPASEKQLEQAKESLRIEDFAQAVIASAEYTAPYLNRLIPMDSITVEDANEFYNLSYPEAITRLLGGEQGTVYASAPKQEEKPRKEFALPSAGREMRRMYAYLLKHRFLDRNVVNAFVRAGLLYESCEKFKDREYHNAVFVGKDENGVPRHAHKRSLNSLGKTFRINVEGSDPRCSFHYTGTSDRLYVFEAPIDLMSFLSRYPRGWQEHSFVALCGTAEHAMLWMLERNPCLRAICLCLDHDEAGIEASGRLAEILHEHGYDDVGMLQSEHKDWNEDLKARRGLPAQEAEEHPQLIAASEVCGRIGVYMEECVIPERVGRELTNALCGYEMNLRRDYPEGATTCIELASALALYAYGRGLRQLGEPHSSEELLEQLRSCIHPHQNRSSLNSRTAVLAEQAHAVLKLASKPGIRSEAEKRQLTEGWLELALSCAKISVKYEADVLKQQQKQEQAALQQEMG